MVALAAYAIGQKKKLALRFWTGPNWQNAQEDTRGGVGSGLYAITPWGRGISRQNESALLGRSALK